MTGGTWLPEFAAGEGARELSGVTDLLYPDVVRDTECVHPLELIELGVFYNL